MKWRDRKNKLHATYTNGIHKQIHGCWLLIPDWETDRNKNKKIFIDP